MDRDSTRTHAPQTAAGDRAAPGTITVGDAEVFLAALPASSVPLILFSPPYNLGTTAAGSSGFAAGRALDHYPATAGLGRRGGRRSTGKWHGGALADGYDDYDDALPHEDYVAWQQRLLQACWRCLADDGAIFYVHKPRILNGTLHTPLDLNPGLPVRQVVIWQRAGGVNFSPTHYCPMCEWIVIMAKPAFRLRDRAASGVGDVWSVPQEGGTWHPAPFPLALAERVLETVAPSFVVDPMIGSGTTAVAAVRAGIPYLGNDRNAAYVARAAVRVAQTGQQHRLTLVERAATLPLEGL